MISLKSFLKIAMTFTISPCLSGTIYFFLKEYLKNISKADNVTTEPLSISVMIFLGVSGGLIFFSIPAFILGTIYALTGLKKSIKTYILVIFSSPLFFLIYDYVVYAFPYRPKNDPAASIPYHIYSDPLIPILLSLSSLIAAWLTFPKDD